MLGEQRRLRDFTKRGPPAMESPNSFRGRAFYKIKNKYTLLAEKKKSKGGAGRRGERTRLLQNEREKKGGENQLGTEQVIDSTLSDSGKGQRKGARGKDARRKVRKDVSRRQNKYYNVSGSPLGKGGGDWA